MKKGTVLLAIAVVSAFGGFTSKYLPNKEIVGIECDRILHKKAFDICYSCKRKTPLMVVYSTKKNLVYLNNYSRKKLRFRPDYQLPAKCRSYSKSYSRTGYDRGHLAPNALFDYDRKIQKETFLMSNIAPQKPLLNRRVWAKIERYVRIATMKYKSLNVVTGVCGKQGHIKNGVAVPRWWFKIIYRPNLDPVAFLVPNTNKNMRWARADYFLVAPKKIYKVCGFEILEKTKMKRNCNQGETP